MREQDYDTSRVLPSLLLEQSLRKLDLSQDTWGGADPRGGGTHCHLVTLTDCILLTCCRMISHAGCIKLPTWLITLQGVFERGDISCLWQSWLVEAIMASVVGTLICVLNPTGSHGNHKVTAAAGPNIWHHLHHNFIKVQTRATF